LLACSQRLRLEDMPSIVDIQLAALRDLVKDRKITLDVCMLLSRWRLFPSSCLS
jgi:hypothetical protein